MRILGLTVVAALVPNLTASAQVPPTSSSGPPADAATVEVAAGPQYAGGWLRRWLLGSSYRTAWTAPIRVPVLDLATFAGGLTPLSQGGGLQTKSLWLRGADGYQYAFRSVDKHAASIPEAMWGTLLEDLALDQNSSLYPGAAIAVSRLARAADVPEPEQMLVFLPDDAMLGEFRERFKNTLGTFARRATVPDSAPAFAGAVEIIRSGALLERLDAGPDDLAHAPALLKARLFDVWIGDRDRHRGQWTWARFDDRRPALWHPIPEDRDQAFVDYDGLVFALGRKATVQSPTFNAGELTTFGPDYSSVIGSTWSARELDRRILPGLAPAVWDSIVRDLATRMTDAVIDDALRALPEPYYALHGATLGAALRSRRERLPEFAERFRRLLAEEVDVHATAVPELVTAEWAADGTLVLELARRETPERPYYRRAFARGETRELRLYLHGGGDSVVVRGRGVQRLRIIGSGTDVIVDSSTGGRVRVYSPTGPDHVTGPGRPPVDSRPYRPPFTMEEGHLPPPDWNHRSFPSLLLAGGPDVGVLIGGGASYTRYGFWKYPYAYSVEARLGIATGPPTAAGDLRVTVYRRNSRVHGDLYMRGSGIDVLRFHGLGNDVELTEPTDYYLVDQRQFEITPTLTLPLAARVSLRIGPTAQYTRTKDQPGRVIADLAPYGSEHYGQIGGLAALSLDLRPRGTASVTGFALDLGARVFPPLWDVDSLFADLHGEAVVYLGSEAVPLRPVLALRGGGAVRLGRYPFHEAAFIGDQRTVRLGRQNRYGGDAVVYGNAELRLRLARITLILPSDVGVLGLADAGRVFLEGESSSTWHTAFGGGVWIAVLDARNVLSLTVTRGSEFTGVYFGFGFAY